MSSGGSPQWDALLFLTFVLVIAHFSGHNIADMSLFQAGYNLIKLPLDLVVNILNATIGAGSAVGGILILAAFSLLIMPGIQEFLGEGILNYAVVVAIIAIVIGAWTF